MIEPTDEMVATIRERIGCGEVAAFHAATAVLAIMERDYDVQPRYRPTRSPACTPASAGCSAHRETHTTRHRTWP